MPFLSSSMPFFLVEIKELLLVLYISIFPSQKLHTWSNVHCAAARLVVPNAFNEAFFSPHTYLTLYSVSCFLGTLIGALHSSKILRTTVCNTYYCYLYFTNRKIKAQNGLNNFPKVTHSVCSEVKIQSRLSVLRVGGLDYSSMLPITRRSVFLPISNPQIHCWRHCNLDILYTPILGNIHLYFILSMHSHGP